MEVAATRIDSGESIGSSSSLSLGGFMGDGESLVTVVDLGASALLLSLRVVLRTHIRWPLLRS